MEPLKTNKLAMMAICMCAPDESLSKRQRLAHKMFALTMSIILAFSITCYTAYICVFISTEFDKSLFTLSSDLILCEMLYSLVMGFVLQHKMQAIYGKLSTIYDECK